MSPNNTTTPASPKINLPTIKLDTTLSALYKQHCPSLSTKRIGHIFCGTTCAADLTASFPRNAKYIYQDGAFNDASRADKPKGKDDSADIANALASKYLSLVPQRDAFIAGPDPVIFFYSGDSGAERRHDEAETARTLAVLEESQKPEPIFCPGPGDVRGLAETHGIDAVGVKLVVDLIAELGVLKTDGSDSESGRKTAKMLIDPDLLWFLNGKEALAKSGLPTPKTDVIEVHGCVPEAANCCQACLDSKDVEIPDDCVGPRNRWLGEQTLRILTSLRQQDLPFVFKNQQAFAGAGTYVITKGSDRHDLIEEMVHGGILRRLLSRITKANVHLRPGSILLMHMVEDPVADIGITFFVSEDGSPTFLAASEQMIDRASSSWIGSKISYPNQDALRSKFDELIDQIASWLHKQGYFGPVGADILETKTGECLIVDLNVRTSGSLCLPLLRTHFTSRGLQCASSFSVTVQKTRDEFSEQWKMELESGEMCIVAWYEDEKAGKSFGDVVVGAKDEDGLSDILARVRDATEQVTF